MARTIVLHGATVAPRDLPQVRERLATDLAAVAIGDAGGVDAHPAGEHSLGTGRIAQIEWHLQDWYEPLSEGCAWVLDACD